MHSYILCFPLQLRGDPTEDLAKEMAAKLLAKSEVLQNSQSTAARNSSK